MKMPSVPNDKFNCWAHDKNTFELYRRRCLRQEQEMTCAAQAADILAPLAKKGETLLDAGCAAGYYFWSFSSRGIPIEYHGLDYTQKLVELGRKELCPVAGLDPSRLSCGRIEDLDMPFDNIICFNVLTNSPHYAECLDRMLASARRRIIIRESMSDTMTIRYSPDPYLDPEYRHLNVYHNTYHMDEVIKFIEAHGFTVHKFVDKRTNDGMEMVVDIPHYWKILLAERI